MAGCTAKVRHEGKDWLGAPHHGFLCFLSAFIGVHQRPAYSHRNAFVGLTEAARHAGNIADPSATNPSSILATAMVGTSTARTPKSWPSTRRLNANRHGSATAIPAPIILNASRAISHTAERVVAPSAMRIPISCVRWVAT